MALAQTYSNYPSYIQEEEILTINFDSFLLAILTSHDIEITEEELFINVQNLFTELNLAFSASISKDIADSLPSLVTSQYLEFNEEKYQLSNKGKTLGLKALRNFQEFVQTFLKN